MCLRELDDHSDVCVSVLCSHNYATMKCESVWRLNDQIILIRMRLRRACVPVCVFSEIWIDINELTPDALSYVVWHWQFGFNQKVVIFNTIAINYSTMRLLGLHSRNTRGTDCIFQEEIKSTWIQWKLFGRRIGGANSIWPGFRCCVSKSPFYLSLWNV